MKIYGVDTVVPTFADFFTQPVIVGDWMATLWPNAVVETLIQNDQHHEACFYKNEAAQQSWEEHGRTDDNAQDMMYILFGKQRVTVVHEGLVEEELSDLSKRLQEGLPEE